MEWHHSYQNTNEWRRGNGRCPGDCLWQTVTDWVRVWWRWSSMLRSVCADVWPGSNRHRGLKEGFRRDKGWEDGHLSITSPFKFYLVSENQWPDMWGDARVSEWGWEWGWVISPGSIIWEQTWQAMSCDVWRLERVDCGVAFSHCVTCRPVCIFRLSHCLKISAAQSTRSAGDYTCLEQWLSWDDLLNNLTVYKPNISKKKMWYLSISEK